MSFANNITNTVGTLGVSRGGTNLTATPTNGQLPIGNGTDYTLATLTAGSGISVTNASGSITIAATGGGGGFTSIVIQTFTSSGTYTPTSGMSRCIVEVVGGGGGSGGMANLTGTTSSRNARAGPGAGGGYAKKLFTSATIGASRAVTIGAGGTAGAAGNNAGGAGGTTEFGASPSILLQATGGAGGPGSAATSSTFNFDFSAPTPGVGTLGDVNISGFSYPSSGDSSSTIIIGNGGQSFYSGSAPGYLNCNWTGPTLTNLSTAGLNIGGGASGQIHNVGTGGTSAARAGAAGAAGIVIITEFIT